ncbi:hypothetical protein [Flavobacterium sp.]|uniref:hypothetical protein n=1 Tax=Flavobacterium sp. TaxID=239 RepID=UPI0037C17D91
MFQRKKILSKSIFIYYIKTIKTRLNQFHPFNTRSIQNYVIYEFLKKEQERQTQTWSVALVNLTNK